MLIWRGRGILVPVIAFACSLLAAPAFAANIQTLTQAEVTLEENNVGCNIALQGEIHEGDLEGIQNAFGKLRKVDHFFDSICLTSPGGSFAEGLRIRKTKFR